MTNDKDIIGIVKELKDNKVLHAICEDVAVADSNSHLWELLSDHDLTTDAAYFASNIPKLAQALLVAVEALENVKEHSNCCGECCGDEAEEAVKRIRSLHSA